MLAFTEQDQGISLSVKNAVTRSADRGSNTPLDRCALHAVAAITVVKVRTGREAATPHGHPHPFGR
jgi:hypothetical protein